MFGVEPSEKLSKREMRALDLYAAKHLRQMVVRALQVTAIFGATILAVIPFTFGHSLHSYWDRIGKYLVLVAEAELLWFVARWGYVYASWQATRDTKREMRDVDDGSSV